MWSVMMPRWDRVLALTFLGSLLNREFFVYPP